MVWIDCEMTGLSLTDDALIEVAVLVTDDQLNVLGALGDIKDSIDELRYYREAVFVDDPGPSSDQAREAASRVVAARRLAEQSGSQDELQA